MEDMNECNGTGIIHTIIKGSKRLSGNKKGLCTGHSHPLLNFGVILLLIVYSGDY